MNKKELEKVSKPTEAFPGHSDAGKLLEWVSQQISLSPLGKDLKSEP